MKNLITFIRTSNALMLLVLMGILTAAYYQQYCKHEVPCPLCILQRLGMIGISTGLLLNLRFGVQIKHYAISILSCLVGGAIALFQMSLHFCPDSPSFGIPVCGLGLYTWSFIVFCCSLFAIIIFLFLYESDQKKKVSMNFFEHFAFFVLFALTVLNLITTYLECGLSYCF